MESNNSGRLSDVFSQLAMIPCSGSLLSRDKCSPLDTWKTSGLQENVFGNQFSTFERRVEVLAQDLPCFGGAQLAVNVTLLSALTRDGEPQPNAADEHGAVLVQARHDKENTYSELVASAIETRGRWSEEAVNILHQLAVAHTREVTAYMTHQVALVWERRWTHMLASTCAVAFATSLVAPSRQCDTWCHTGGEAPGLCDLLTLDPR